MYSMLYTRESQYKGLLNISNITSLIFFSLSIIGAKLKYFVGPNKFIEIEGREEKYSVHVYIFMGKPLYSSNIYFKENLKCNKSLCEEKRNNHNLFNSFTEAVQFGRCAIPFDKRRSLRICHTYATYKGPRGSDAGKLIGTSEQYNRPNQ